MADLILTSEEKAANKWLELDDATLGKFVKYTAMTALQAYSEEGAIRLNAALIMLLGTVAESKEQSLQLKVNGLVYKGDHHGDWDLTISRNNEARPSTPPRAQLKFDAEMFVPILSGQKTQTRRVLKSAPSGSFRYDGVGSEFDDGGNTHYFEELGANGEFTEKYVCVGECPYADVGCALLVEGFKSRPLIASAIRIERLQDISNEDAWAEGCDLHLYSELGFGGFAGGQEDFIYGGYARKTFVALWGRIYGADSWAKNPWVWVINFHKSELH